MKRTIVVTGASGFIGTGFIKRYSSHHKVKTVKLREQVIENIDFKDVDTILHLSALVHQMNNVDDSLYFKINRDTTLELAKHAKNAGVKHFVFMSTVKVYGEYTKENLPFDENSQCNPTDSYGKSKLEAEKGLRSLEDTSFKVSIIRPPLVYGKNVRANMLKIINLTYRHKVLPFGGINNIRSIVFLDNLLSLINEVVIQQKVGVFIAKDELSISTTNLIQIIAKTLNKKIYLIKSPSLLIRILKYFKPTIYNRIYGSLELEDTFTRNELNYTPPFSTEEGINYTVNWYLKNN